jgi:chloride channel protein, CIC family
MFLVRRAGDVMERDVVVMPADADLDEFLRRHSAGGGFKHVVVARGNHIVGVVRINTGIRHGIEAAYSGVTMDTVAQRNFTLARENDIVFDNVQRMSRRDAGMAVVIKVGGRGRPSEVVGVISKEQIADSVAESIKPFA